MNQWKGCLRCWVPTHRKHDKSRRTAPSLQELNGPQERTPSIPRDSQTPLTEHRSSDSNTSPASLNERGISTGGTNPVSPSSQRPQDYRSDSALLDRPVSPVRNGVQTESYVRAELRRESDHKNTCRTLPSSHAIPRDALPSSSPIPLSYRSQVGSSVSTSAPSSEHSRSLSRLLSGRPGPTLDAGVRDGGNVDEGDYIPLNECYSGNQAPPVPPPPSRARLNSATTLLAASHIPSSPRINGNLLNLVIPPPTAIQRNWNAEPVDEYMTSNQVSQDNLCHQYRRQQSHLEHDPGENRQHISQDELPDYGCANGGFDDGDPQAMYGSANYQEQRFADMVNSRCSLWQHHDDIRHHDNFSPKKEVRLRLKVAQQRSNDREEAASQYISMNSCSTPSGQSQLKDFKPNFNPIPAPRKFVPAQSTQPQSASVRDTNSLYTPSSASRGVNSSHVILNHIYPGSTAVSDSTSPPEEAEYLFSDRSTASADKIVDKTWDSGAAQSKELREVLISSETNYDSLPYDDSAETSYTASKIIKNQSNNVESLTPPKKKKVPTATLR